MEDLHFNYETDKVIITYGMKFYFYNYDRLDLIPNSIEVRNISNLELEYQDVIKKYYVDTFGKEYKLFVEESKLISNNNVLIIYKAVLKNRTSEEKDNDIFIFEIKNIE